VLEGVGGLEGLLEGVWLGLMATRLVGGWLESWMPCSIRKFWLAGA
jgi:hypothetical protein